eukprot:comp6378_c0_seq1/m.2176 comp6378_c0_seq1/g.2176  ORF comp6378_c0_seq1/g.2176 comp6378_c0_seq1/m.2176 type:complete len:289 (-) comp6378_c0_seq1:626-1492(-)
MASSPAEPPATKNPQDKLLEAIGAGKAQLVADALREGASVNAILGHTGSLPVITAAKTPATDVMETLLLHGAAANVVDSKGWSPLHWAAVFNHVPMVQLLCRHGADLHCRTHGGRSALDLATLKNNTEVKECLLAWAKDRGIELKESPIMPAGQLRPASTLASWPPRDTTLPSPRPTPTPRASIGGTSRQNPPLAPPRKLKPPPVHPEILAKLLAQKRGRESESPPALQPKKTREKPRSVWGPKEPNPEKCLRCGVTETIQWRKGPEGKKNLCNSCGVRYYRSLHKNK